MSSISVQKPADWWNWQLIDKIPYTGIMPEDSANMWHLWCWRVINEIHRKTSQDSCIFECLLESIRSACLAGLHHATARHCISPKLRTRPGHYSSEISYWDRMSPSNAFWSAPEHLFFFSWTCVFLMLFSKHSTLNSHASASHKHVFMQSMALWCTKKVSGSPIQYYKETLGRPDL